MTKPRPFGHYFILEKIAQGGMAEIFKGLTYDFSGLKKFIVIKRILPHIAANPEFIKMLVDEAKLAVQLNHGNIAQTFDLGKVAEDYFIVMEYVEGKTLSQVYKKSVALKKSLPIPFVVYILNQLCQGLDYMHHAQDSEGRPLKIVHCDISPQNIIVGEGGAVKVVDFGVAKALAKLGETDKGVLKGKFAYMSPEQTRGEVVDARSDLFSAGVLFWEALTGRRLFKKSLNAKTIEAVQQMQIYPPSAYRAELPPALDAIVLKALARDPKERFYQASDLALELTKFNLEHYPDFKPSQCTDILGEFFQEEEGTLDLAYEKTHFDSLSLAEEESSHSSSRHSSQEVTAIVDLQSLELESLFEDIDMEEVSEVTRAIELDADPDGSDLQAQSQGLASDLEKAALLQESLQESLGKSKKIWPYLILTLALLGALALFWSFN